MDTKAYIRSMKEPGRVIAVDGERFVTVAKATQRGALMTNGERFEFNTASNITDDFHVLAMGGTRLKPVSEFSDHSRRFYDASYRDAIEALFDETVDTDSVDTELLADVYGVAVAIGYELDITTKDEAERVAAEYGTIAGHLSGMGYEVEHLIKLLEHDSDSIGELLGRLT